MLEDALAGVAPPVHLTPVTRDAAVAREWFDVFEGAGLDGVIAKREDDRYVPGKRVMAKIKHVRTADCVLAGYRPHKSIPDAVGSLLLGLYDDGSTPASQWADMFGGLMSVGVVGAFPAARRRELFAELQPLVCDFAEHPWGGLAEVASGRGAGSRWNPGKDLSFVPAAAGARARGPLRPHGGLALPTPAAVRPLAARPRAGVVRLRAARGSGSVRFDRRARERVIWSCCSPSG